jgi:aryl-alcohol dehydrogenase-like predicted oxidoreductase
VFDELIRAGKVRHTGLLNYSGAGVEEAVGAAIAGAVAVPVNLQSSYSLLDQAAAADAFGACARYGLGFTAFSPLAGGWLSGKYRAGPPYPDGSRMTLRPEPYAHLTVDATDKLIDAVDGAARMRGLALPTMALAWVLTDPGVTASIVGPRTPAQLDLMCAAVDIRLTADDRAGLTADRAV